MLDDDGVRDLKIVSLGHFLVNSFRHNVRILKSNANKTGCNKKSQRCKAGAGAYIRIPLVIHQSWNTGSRQRRYFGTKITKFERMVIKK